MENEYNWNTVATFTEASLRKLRSAPSSEERHVLRSRHGYVIRVRTQHSKCLVGRHPVLNASLILLSFSSREGAARIRDARIQDTS